MPNITQLTIANSVGAPATEIGVRLLPTFWYVKYGGAAIKLSHLRGNTEVGSVRGGLGGAGGVVAMVETINVSADRQRRGLGRLLAAVFCAHWAANGATHVQLGTNDTSGGFWASLGVSQANAITIVAAQATIFGVGGIVRVRRE